MYFNFVNLYYLDKGMLCLFTQNIYIYFICYLSMISVIRYRLHMMTILSEVCEKMLPTYFQIFIFCIT